ncbi:MAG: hypothetical protein HY905_15885 [Deltaproteobacteria bacterium]|nr:hypothetical protein [Deltaproteobacteria bacterium]
MRAVALLGVACVAAGATSAACWQSYREESADPDAAGCTVTGCAVWAVPEGTGPGPGDGTASNPYLGLQAAFDHRGDCDRIVLRPDPDGAPFSARVDLLFADDGALRHLVLEADPCGTEPAVLDAAGAAGLVVDGPVGTLTLRRVAVRRGRSTSGGCLEAREPGFPADLFLEDTEWTDCAAHLDGGAVASDGAAVHVVDSLFSDDTAGRNGGAIAARDCQLVVARSRFLRDSANVGGAVWVEGHAVVTDSVFADNRAGTLGGAVSGMGSGVWSGNRFDGNRALDAGAVRLHSGPMHVFHNLVADNVSGTTPAFWLDSDVTVTNNIFARNLGGGALGVDGGLVQNNVLVDNEGILAAHLYVAFGAAAAEGNIFVGGAGPSGIGCGAYADNSAEHNDFWQVPAPALADDCGAGVNLETDPRFIDPDAGDYHLRPGSPCIDAGTPGHLAADVDGSRNDMGAFGGPQGDWVPPP